VWLRGVALVVLIPFVLAACGGSDLPAAPGAQRLAAANGERLGAAAKYAFTTIDDQNNPNFNELLGLNNEAKIVGFYGSGGVSDPNRGYVVRSPYGQLNFKEQNYPHSIDSQVAAVNNKGALGGWYSVSGGYRYGFMVLAAIWYSYADPSAGKTTKIYGVNDSLVAVGYYETPQGRKRPFEVDVPTGKYTDLNPPRAVDAVATGITGRGDIGGWLTDGSGKTLGWLWRQGYYTEYSFPQASATKFLGITIHDWIAGSYVDKSGETHGFVLTEPLRPAKTVWQKIDEPYAAHGTVVTGLNLHRELVGYYVDAKHLTHGFLAIPKFGR